ncbi:hypothetical protein GCM10009007_09380 [Formosimonas limnophila]|uniref:TauD/TfdA-like domain-containing protein n=1 Tax=Formosimonas limnophila TaxID=1384487 RepID=A0A8J3CMH8_9BURK|nr:TauD/TfdA family dioxygenase [Formosimonas limnophila]GHA70692.1 hypothetical protein GCM10009007_09380 [Formosimonas limnophila]
MNNIIYSDGHLTTNETITQIKHHLKNSGWVLLRDFEMSVERFSALMKQLCTRLTFDPAREYMSGQTQKVDAGTLPVGLHNENGNTPFPPHVVAFYSRRAARRGSQTTVCDGTAILEDLPPDIRELLSMPVLVSRHLPEQRWKTYVLNEHPKLEHIEQVTRAHLDDLIQANTRQSYVWHDDGTIYYNLKIHAIDQSIFSGKSAFINSILGPSYNYEPPVFTLANDQVIDDALKSTLHEIGERHTIEVDWHDEDVVIIDNTRVLHGRRAILDADRRELHIGMGFVTAA